MRAVPEDRTRTRWWPALAVVAVAATAASVVLAGLAGAGVERDRAFLERAVTVDALVTDQDCTYGYRSSHCANRLAFTLDGEERVETRHRWNLPVGDRVAIAVDRHDPSRIARAGEHPGDGAWLLLGAFGAGCVAAASAAGVHGRRRPALDGTGAAVFHRSSMRWAAAAAVAPLGAMAALVLAGAGGADPLGRAAAAIIGGAVTAAGFVWWQFHGRPDRLVVDAAAIATVTCAGQLRRRVHLGPGTVVRVHQVRRELRFVVDDRSTTLTTSTGTWGADTVGIASVLVGAARRRGATIQT